MVDISKSELRAADTAQRPARPGWPGWGPASGFAFVVVFVASVFLDTTPDANASNAAWTSYFASAGHRETALAAGFLAVVAALALMSFLVITWTRIAAAGRAGLTSPLPVAAAAVCAACITAGSLLQALIPASMTFNSLPEPSPDIMRVLNQAAGPLILVGGMLALALAMASLALQARAAGAFGKALTIFTLIAAVITVFSFQFFPVLAPLAWTATISIVLIRRPALTPRA
jgi:hypothetical protein